MLRKESRHLEQAIAESLITKSHEDSQVQFSTLDDLKACLSKNQMSDFTVIIGCSTITIGKFEVSPIPLFKYCINVNSDLQISAFKQSVELEILDGVKLPKSVNNTHNILDILKKLEGVETAAQENIPNLIGLITCFLNKLESSVADDRKCVVQFLKEQLNLLRLQKQRFRYSPHCLVFACILNSISPHAYKFLR